MNCDKQNVERRRLPLENNGFFCVMLSGRRMLTASLRLGSFSIPRGMELGIGNLDQCSETLCKKHRPMRLTDSAYLLSLQ